MVEGVIRLPCLWQCLTVLIVLAVNSPAAEEAPSDWKIVKGKHFLVYHREDDSFAQRTAAKAEDHYRTIAADLGFTKYGDFWTWDKRVKIYIYASQKEFVGNTGAPVWAGGKADYRRKEISTFKGSSKFLESVLPHELAHLVLRDFVGFTGRIPLWLDEGVAQWAEKGERERALRRVRRLAERGGLKPLRELMTVSVRDIKDPVVVADFYAQSVGLVGFLKGRGAERFRKLCGQLRDGKSLDDALRFTYPSSWRNITELEKAWKKSLARKQR